MEAPEIVARLAHHFSSTKPKVRKCIALLQKRYPSLPEEEVFAILRSAIPSSSDGTYPPLPQTPPKPLRRYPSKKIPEESAGECFSCYNPIFKMNTSHPFVCIAAKNPMELKDPMELPPSEREVRYVVMCPACECKVCVTDLVGYYSTNKLKPSCINGTCGVEFDMSILKRYIPLSHLPRFTQLLKSAIFEEEMSRLPLTEANVAISGYSTLGDTRLTISGELAARVKTSKTAIKLKKLPVKCLIDGCPGVLSEKLTCEKCSKKKCRKCKEYKAPNHVCDEYILQLIEEEKRNGCQCPQCGEVWQKTTGCDHMWCVACHAHYNYVKGGVGKLIPKKEQTNPAWREYQRMKAAMKASKADIQLGVDNIGECPQDNVFPNLTTLVINTSFIHGFYDKDVHYLIEGVHRLSTNNAYGFPTETYQRILQEENLDMEREFILLARDQVKINTDIVSPQIHDISGNLLPLRKSDRFISYVGDVIPSRILDMETRTYNYDECVKLFTERAFKHYKRQLYARRYLDIANMFRASSSIALNNISEIFVKFKENSVRTKEVFASVRNAIVQELESLVSLIKQTNGFFKEFCDAQSEWKCPYISHNLNFISPSKNHLVSRCKQKDDPRHSLINITLQDNTSLSNYNTFGMMSPKIMTVEKWELPAWVAGTALGSELNTDILGAIATKKFKSVRIDMETGKHKTNEYYCTSTPSELNIMMSFIDIPFLEKIVASLEEVKEKLTGDFFVKSGGRDDYLTVQDIIDLVAKVISFSQFTSVTIKIKRNIHTPMPREINPKVDKLIAAISGRKFRKLEVTVPVLDVEDYKRLLKIVSKEKPFLGHRSWVMLTTNFNDLYPSSPIYYHRGFWEDLISKFLGPNYKEKGITVNVDTYIHNSTSSEPKTNVIGAPTSSHPHHETQIRIFLK